MSSLLANSLQIYIHLYSHKLQLQKQEFKKNKGKRDTQRVKEHNVHVKCILTMHSGSAR